MSLALALSACGSSTAGGNATGGASSGGASSGGASSGGASSGGANSSEPTQFSSVAQLWIGSPDSAATIVVYAFSEPTACDLLSAPGWDAKLSPGTKQLELKEFGSGPAVYKVVTTKTPAPGEAAVNYNTNASGTAVETSLTGGTVTLSAVNATKRVTGSYALTFGTTHLDGAFDATYCAGGVEP